MEARRLALRGREVTTSCSDKGLAHSERAGSDVGVLSELLQAPGGGVLTGLVRSLAGEAAVRRRPGPDPGGAVGGNGT